MTKFPPTVLDGAACRDFRAIFDTLLISLPAETTTAGCREDPRRNLETSQASAGRVIGLVLLRNFVSPCITDLFWSHLQSIGALCEERGAEFSAGSYSCPSSSGQEASAEAELSSEERTCGRFCGNGKEQQISCLLIMDLQNFHESGGPRDCRTAGKSFMLESKTSILEIQQSRKV